MGKHEDSSKSNNDQAKDESNERKSAISVSEITSTTDVPTVGNVVIPLQQGDTVVVTATCSDGS